MIGRSGVRGSGISMLAARHDDDDDDNMNLKKGERGFSSIVDSVDTSITRFKDDIRGSLNKFPDFFRMGTFLDSTHMKLYSPSK